jgi:hypothetical protein
MISKRFDGLPAAVHRYAATLMPGRDCASHVMGGGQRASESIESFISYGKAPTGEGSGAHDPAPASSPATPSPWPSPRQMPSD